MFYVYILQSTKSDKYYIGSTNDPVKRLTTHNISTYNTFTAKYRPWKLVAVFPVGESRNIAVRYERKLKSLKSRKIINELIQHNGDVCFFTQLVRVPTGRD
jgi:putative endonuclease